MIDRSCRGAAILAAALLGAGLALLGGCSAPQQLYDAIEPGQPLPAAGSDKLPRDVMRTDYGLSATDTAQMGLPIHMHTTLARVVAEPDGPVIARSYFTSDITHWGLCVLMTSRNVIEIEIPESAFRDPPKGWTPDFQAHYGHYDLFLEAGKKGRELAGHADEPDHPQSDVRKETLPDAPAARRFAMAAARGERVSGLASGVKQKTAGEVPAEEGPPPPGPAEPLPPQDAGQYMVYALMRLESVPFYTPSTLEPRVFGMVPQTLVQFSSAPLSYLFDQAGVFDGITQTGYERTVKLWFLSVGDVHIRNVGGRRIRIEDSGFFVTDPIVAPLLADAMLKAKW